MNINTWNILYVNIAEKYIYQSTYMKKKEKKERYTWYNFANFSLSINSEQKQDAI